MPAEVKTRKDEGMTIKELSRLYYLNKLIERDESRLAELEARLSPGGMSFSRIPQAQKKCANTFEDAAIGMIELKERILAERGEYIRERDALEAYINSVKDCRMRLILTYRFVDLMSWTAIAMRIGGGNTDESIKKACYRFLEKGGGSGG